ncbi:SMI1/KNR4 family protein [Kitasatospora sp. NPDC051914]|uniref:SMI1/KNR4 family protein n=1 Tax=Kitasatospora sp. NPDC051914 TaxID=3154945 RepID=UPI00341FDB0E
MTDRNDRRPQPSYPWRELLQRWSDDWLDPVLHEQESPEPFPSAMRETRWLGGRGADAAEIVRLEQRLGTGLPPSYRQFLRTSNDWHATTAPRNSLPSAATSKVTT